MEARTAESSSVASRVMMFMLVVAPMRAVGVSRALMEVERRGSAINGFFAREFGADCTETRSRVVHVA